MRVLQINVCYGYSSTGRNVQEIAETLDNKNIDNYVAYVDAISPRLKDYKMGNKLSCKTHAICSRIFGLQGYFSYFSTLNLIKFIDKIKPDVIHLNNLHSNYIHIYKLLDYIAKNDIATVVTMHDCFFYTGKCCHYTLAKCNRWTASCGNCPLLKQDNKSYFFDRTTKMLKDKEEHFKRINKLAIVGVSDWITSDVKKSILKDASIITRIYNWIDLNKFRPRKSIFREKMNLDNDFVVLSVASLWTKGKGISFFIEIANNLPNFKFIIVGSLESKIQFPSNVIHVDETNNVDELVDIYNAADVFANTSMEETFGKVTAEALSCGVPAIVMNSTASPELIHEGCGYICKNNSVKEFIEHLKTIKKYTKSYYSENCRKFAEENFDKNINIDKQIKLYKEIINR